MTHAEKRESIAQEKLAAQSDGVLRAQLKKLIGEVANLSGCLMNDAVADRIAQVAARLLSAIPDASPATSEIGADYRRGLEDAAKVAERDVDWTTFSKRGLEQWDGGVDAARDYRVGIAAGQVIANAIRSLAASPFALSAGETEHG